MKLVKNYSLIIKLLKQPTLFLVIAYWGLYALQAQTTILRVNSLSNADEPDGSSWANAYHELEDALIASSEIMTSLNRPDSIQIWIAKGIYYPTQTAVRTRSFFLQNNVSWYGGFAGTENSLDQRNLALVDSLQAFISDSSNNGTWNKETLVNRFSATVLSGDIGVKNNASDNSYHVIVGADIDTATLNALVIMDGNASGNNLTAQSGGGMFNNQSSPTLAKCNFTLNTVSSWGAGMYNLRSSPKLDSCSFSFNQTKDFGGGMFNNQSSPTLTDCSFSSNEANSGGRGGGMYNISSNPILNNCSFSSNEANSGGGGGMYNVSSKPILNNCSFIENRVDSLRGGGGMMNIESDATLNNCTFDNNQAGAGGGIYNSSSKPMLDTCRFVSNKALNSNWGGGGIYNNFSQPKLNSCVFRENTVIKDGGAIYNYSSEPTLENCTLKKNKANNYGGGMYNYNSPKPILARCSFIENRAVYGGGVYNWSSAPTITNCSFIKNQANKDGGGILSKTGEVELVNCTLSENQAIEGKGGGVFCQASINIKGSTIHQNWAKVEGGGFYIHPEGSIDILQSILARNNTESTNDQDFHITIEDSLSSLGYNLVGIADGFADWQDTDTLGTAIAPLDPMLDTLADNGGPTKTHALLKNSPAINAGAVLSEIPSGLETDQRGYARFTGSQNSDIGAYERLNAEIDGAGNFSICDGEGFKTIDDIVLIDAAGGAFIEGDNQILILSLPLGFEYDITNASITFEGEALVDQGSIFDLNNNQITLKYKRAYTNSKNSITISGLQARFEGADTVTTGIIRRIGGDAKQVGNAISDSVFYGSLTGLPVISDTFFSDFESDHGQWVASGEHNLWKWTEPNNSIINAAVSGNKAWITQTDSIGYEENNTSILLSSCYDLSSFTNPFISLNIWSDAQESFDGTTLEYYYEDSSRWHTLGAPTTGIEWFDTIPTLAHSNLFGWTGRDTTWKLAFHSLPPHARANERFRLRLIFASGEVVNPKQTNNGFAFDDFSISDRNLNLLFEQYTNLDNAGLGHRIIAENPNSLIPIRYFLTKGEGFYGQNPVGPRTRALYYGISEPGISVLSGKEYLGPTNDLNQKFLDRSKLRGSVIDIKIDSTHTDSTIQITSSKEFMIVEELIVHFALLENGIMGSGTTYDHVFRKFLPDAGGTSFWGWPANHTEVFPLSWFEDQPSLNGYVDNFDSLHLVVFVQNQQTKEVYQAASIKAWPELIAALENRKGISASNASLTLYPNPIQDQLTLDFGRELEADKEWKLIDIQGRILKSGICSKGEQTFRFEMQDIAKGHYLLRIEGNEIDWVYKRIAVMH